jgi:hypothetical protein
LAIHQANGLIEVIKSEDKLGAIGDKRAAINPTIVIGAIAGAAKRLARILIGDRKPAIATMTGAQKTVAAIGAAIA